jgi:hypothetical protein
MEQVVIIVIIGLISLVNWLMKRSAEIREQRREERARLGIPEGDPFHPSEPKSDQPAPPPPGPNVEMRRLMEALGIPMEEAEVLVPTVREEPPVLPPLPAFQPPPAPRKSTAENPNKQAFAIPRAAPETPLSIALRSRDGVRQAIVLREILGPPKAFTP